MKRINISRQQRFRRRRRFLVERLEARRLLASDFTLAILPDTQYYAESAPAIFNSQTQWIADNAQTENIAFVSHVGDVVEHAGSLAEWQNADAAMDTLDGAVPYSVLPGNHDFTSVGTHGDAANFVNTFGASRYSGAPWYGGSSANQLNHYQTFSAGGYQFLHLALEWEPRAAAVSWAQGILDANPTLPAIVSTHAYLRPSGERFTGAVSPDGLDGEQLFQSLITTNPQIFLVAGGHFSGEAHAVSINDAGLPVLEMVVDYQSRPNGGDGFMQLLKFRPDFDTIDVTTYSPTLDAFETDADSQFSFSLDFAARLDFAGAPTAALTSPLDNGPGDTNPAERLVTVNTAEPHFELQLADLFPGVDDATVTAETVQITRDGSPLTVPADYTFDYDAAADRLTLSAAAGAFPDGVYTLTLNGGNAKIADLSGNETATTVYEITIDTSVLGSPDALYFSLSSLTTLDGGVVADRNDVVYFDGADFSLYFDGSDVGLDVLTIDALTVLDANELLLSFTGSATIPGISGTVDDSDIVRFTATQLGDETSGTFSRYFDGSDVGLTTSDEDIDALTILANGHLVISTKGLFDADGVVGDDEDLFEFTPVALGDNTAGSWSLYLDGSDLAGFAEEDVYGVSVYPDGDIYFSLSGSFSVPGLSGKDEDVFAFSPTSLGADTSGTFVSPLFFDGSQYGLSRQDVYSIHIPSAGPSNAPPVALDDLATVTEDGSTTVNVLVDNGNGADYDSDGSIVAATTVVVGSPANGSLLNNGDGSFQYTPDPDFFGTDTFTYRVQDNQGALSNTATVTVTVNPVNDAPTARNDDVATSQGSPLTINVLANNGHGLDGDVDGIVIGSTAAAQSAPANGTLINNGDGTFDYTPAASFLGTDSFTYTVEDNDGATSNPATVTITVSDPADASLSLYFALDAAHTFANGLAVEEQDIVTYDGVDFSLLFDGSDVGLANEKLSGISVIGPTEILMSFTTEATVAGVTGTVLPTDVVKFNATQLGATTAGTFELYFRGANVGFDVAGEAVDGLKLLEDGRLIVSTLSSFSVPGVSGKDEDLLAFTPTALGSATAGTWEMYFDGGDAGWSGQDVDAVAVDPDGNIYFSSKADFTLDIGPVTDDDVFVFVPTSLGTNTAGSYEPALFFDGGNFGLEALNLKAIDVTTAGPQALRSVLAAGASPAAGPGMSLTRHDVELVLPQAVAAWQAAGHDIAGAASITIYVDDLPGNQLGQTFGTAITLDRDAAGRAWHVDPASASVAAGRYDLLTVLTHELGHVLGIAHADGDAVMNSRLNAATRLLPAAANDDWGLVFAPAGNTGNHGLRSGVDLARDMTGGLDRRQRSLESALAQPRQLDPLAADALLAAERDWVVSEERDRWEDADELTADDGPTLEIGLPPGIGPFAA